MGLGDPSVRKNCLKSRGQFPSTSCNKYFNCWDGVVLEEECPPGTLFSEKGWCDYEYNVDCGQRSFSGKKGKKSGKRSFYMNSLYLRLGG